ncbi:ARPP-2 domain-containing protein [Nonomuraea roseoviolacea]|uniref:ARG and Rhodanese-Phosphatase-superfamily-associated domain-containing protein n=1 Tax=Nonomuraea roseoviolacea subsp. carminata TaxID=160689 RepID=A0ABT1K0R0_9ACTN|nr:hypothetical protein [Nonomuraea roseoviolacea]MCP2346609.1 hypothetical protein [Nonomuraea roseoviolacea subsp. carminata]
MIDLTGLETRPAQTWGSVRLVPLVRREPILDLRLHATIYGDEPSVVSLTDRTSYRAYIPHAFVASWTRDGTPAAAYGTQIDEPVRHIGIRTRRRMARRVDKNRLRFLPMHLAVEGYLALHFNGPEIVWEEWSRRDLSPRVEVVYSGGEISGLADALRIFEIYPGQCGLMIYVADALAAATVVPHPDDYRALHPTLIHDLYGELIHEYALYHPVRDVPAVVDASRVASLGDLRAAAERHEREWASFHDTTMAAGMLSSPGRVEEVYRFGPFRLSRFLPRFEPRRENHIGETITSDDGQVAYLKTFRLSQAQIRRGYLLTRLAEHDWHIGRTAAALGTTPEDLGSRLERAGFGHLLRRHVLDHYRAGRRGQAG